MPRRQFIADLTKAQNGVLPVGVTDLKAGDDDGQFQFVFAAAAGNGRMVAIPVQITAIVPDLSEYPSSHQYLTFADDDAPSYISTAIQRVRGLDRKTVFELVDIIAGTLNRLQPDGDGDSPMNDDEDETPEDSEEMSEDEDVYDSDHEAFQISDNRSKPPAARTATTVTSTRLFRDRIRIDLVTTKSAGFKIGILGSLLEGSSAFVTVAIRVAKLNISPEAMQAWQIEPTDYLIMIIRYPNGYKTNEEFSQFDISRLKPYLGFRIVAGKGYKPSLQEAIDAFAVAKEQDNGNSSDPRDDNTEKSSIRHTFISKPLARLLEESLVPILRYRSAGLPWTGAEEWFADQLSGLTSAGNADRIPNSFYEPEVVSRILPRIMHADHYTDGSTTHSFPLLAMQFMLRHFVRCTEFCLVCHRKLKTDVEAIKPYVCERSLCLFQYMTMGFGPSIEHEITAQPYVVDLLVSFCYSSAASRKLSGLPDGLSLTVPPAEYDNITPYNPYGTPYAQSTTVPSQPTTITTLPLYDVGYDKSTHELIFWDRTDKCPVRKGSWIVLTLPSVPGSELHCRVKDSSLYPTIQIDPPIEIFREPDETSSIKQLHGSKTSSDSQVLSKSQRPVSPPAPSNWTPAIFQIYTQDFNDLGADGKMLAICKLLDTLPDVKAMQEYIAHGRDLRQWVEKISSSALSLLRWIIASNRAYIMQVDDTSSKQERLYGMSGHVQFRFAMGAPDKEQRFIEEVRKTQQRLTLVHPTIFAFHGSPIYNWHMIVREGLHFKNADHGRAYGNGVYHAKDAHTSTGYSGMYRRGGTTPKEWQSSLMKVSSAMALSEIVNAPAEFVSQNPFYVVQHLDWIQTRYLFVQCAAGTDDLASGEEVKPSNPHPQDPARTPRGLNNKDIIIPASAIKSSKTVHGSTLPKNPAPKKKQKFSLFRGSSSKDPIKVDDKNDSDEAEDVADFDDLESVATDTDDLLLLFDEEPEETVTTIVQEKKEPDPQTDFIPGSLDYSKLPLMPLPTYAIPSTTTRLMKELQSLHRVQEKTPVAELGWSIDIDKTDNVYQWIVELHSFHTFQINSKSLPLVADMKKAEIKSIILEIRFNKDFPFSPPYVRVVRPRFLTLQQGGGGHIVMGGAMCMELLTNSGWSSVSSMESVLMQIRLAIASEPFARLADARASADYGIGEAAEGYLRACQNHGWEVPKDFRQMAFGTSDESSLTRF